MRTVGYVPEDDAKEQKASKTETLERPKTEDTGTNTGKGKQ